MVLATGGGIVSEPLTFDLILSSFYTVWLKAEPEEHMGRVRRQGDLRPMADDRSAMAELRNILLSREPLYSRAAAVVDTAGLSVDAAAARLIDTAGRTTHTANHNFILGRFVENQIRIRRDNHSPQAAVACKLAGKRMRQ
jgi:XRE family transcriptional regulator, aerobic/anaerobic benzoate catabolism transcriptional regulator